MATAEAAPKRRKVTLLDDYKVQMEAVEGKPQLRFTFTVHAETVKLQHARQVREFLDTGAVTLSVPTYDIISWLAVTLQPVAEAGGSGLRPSDVQQEAVMRVRTPAAYTCCAAILLASTAVH